MVKIFKVGDEGCSTVKIFKVGDDFVVAETYDEAANHHHKVTGEWRPVQLIAVGERVLVAPSAAPKRRAKKKPARKKPRPAPSAPPRGKLLLGRLGDRHLGKPLAQATVKLRPPAAPEPEVGVRGFSTFPKGGGDAAE